MAITTADGWFAAAREKIVVTKTAALASVAAQPFTTFDLAGSPGAGSLTLGNTTSGIVPNDTLAGYPLVRAFGAGATGYLAAARYSSSVAGRAALYDRLYNAGSFALGTLTTFALSGQPTFSSRLPGGVSGSDLEIFLEVNAAIAASAATVAVGYTSEQGAGRTTGASASLASFTTRRLIPMPLQAGDKSVLQITGVTVGGTAAATGTVNVVLARRLASFDVRVANGMDPQAWDMTGAPQVFADSAMWLVTQPDGTTSGAPSLEIDILNG